MKKATAKKAQSPDILNIILEDHKPLKQLIKVMKNSEKYDMSEREAAFNEFAPLLICHAKSEEQVLYVYMKKDDELREEGFEGDVEHTLADQMVEEIKRTEDEDMWSAKVKVLAELVEHHIEEEEEEMFKDIRKNSEREERAAMAEQYVMLRSQYEAAGGEDTVKEKDLKKKYPPQNLVNH